MKLQKLFNEKILDIKELTPGYLNHASDIWLVKTEKEEVIVRASRAVYEEDGIFWSCCKEIFGVNPRNVFTLEKVNNHLCDMTPIRIPRVLRNGFIDREYLVVEKLEGETLKTFINQPKSLLFQLGVGLARIHQHKMNYIGNPSGSFKIDIKNFNQHLIDKMQVIIDKFYLDNQKIVNKLPEMINLFENLKLPEAASYILVDMDPTQFLSDGINITGLVDTEAYVIGPRELDFIALEYVLNEKSAKDFVEGYQTVLEIPDLRHCRIPYRYLYRLVEIQGRDDLDKWLNHPVYF